MSVGLRVTPDNSNAGSLRPDKPGGYGRLSDPALLLDGRCLPGAAGEESTTAEQPLFDRAKHQQLDEDADGEDQQDRGHDDGHVGQVAALVQHGAEAKADAAADGDDLRGHQRAPGEGPALLESAQVAGQCGGEDDLERQLEPGRAQDGADAAVLRRDLVHAGDQPVDDRGDGAHEHHEVHRGVGQAEPDDGRGHPRHGRQHLEPGDQRTEGAAQRGHLGQQESDRGGDGHADQEPDEPALQRGPDGLLQLALGPEIAELAQHVERSGHQVLPLEAQGDTRAAR